MNLQRHHVLYGLLAVSLIIALIVFLTPYVPETEFQSSKTGQEQSTTTPITTATSSVKSTAPAAAMHFEIVTTAADQEKGLGGRASIPSNYGMLFVFQRKDTYGFWMKDMLVPIDMIWLSDDGTILGIEDSVPADSYPKAFYPPKPVKYVLETKAGESRGNGWVIGTKIPLPAPYGA